MSDRLPGLQGLAERLVLERVGARFPHNATNNLQMRPGQERESAGEGSSCGRPGGPVAALSGLRVSGCGRHLARMQVTGRGAEKGANEMRNSAITRECVCEREHTAAQQGRAVGVYRIDRKDG